MQAQLKGVDIPASRHDDAWLPEEVNPCGLPGWMRWHHWPWGTPAPDVDDILVARPRPFRLVLWEPIPTKAPGPHLTHAYCCYIRTVIFYCAPYRIRPFTRLYLSNGRWHPSSGGYEQWDQVDTRLNNSATIEHCGEIFDLLGGRVLWRDGRWWMRYGARRKPHKD